MRLVRAMYPHDPFPDGPYERVADAILDAAREDPRLRAQLDQGLSGASSSAFVEAVRAKAIVTLYNDPEVWAILGRVRRDAGLR